MLKIISLPTILIKTPIEQVYSAILITFRDRKSFFIFIIAATTFFALFIAIPVWTTPANTLAFQLKVFRMQDYILMTLLATLVGLNTALRVYSYKLKKAKVLLQPALQNAASGGLGIFGAIVGTATCASCLATLFGLVGLGAGSVFFVLKNQTLFLLGAVIAMLASLYFTVRKMNKVCGLWPKRMVGK